ncbi:MAG: exodeoxyribonuclease VII large subunit [Candidatus Moranbacteria bacterium]|nr:exodeoxyribonuclease VII large subunit [Candidatus Moranbacteria bacterium]
MNQDIIKKLKSWRSNIANTTGVELFRVFPNKVLEDIARLKPACKEDLLAIKGIREKKFGLYGEDILAIVQECSSEPDLAVEKPKNNANGKDVYNVSDYLDILNSKLGQFGAAVQGEVSSVSFRNGHAYFAIKDKNDESVLNCFMWARNYEMCGVELVEGLEIIIHGTPEVYKPYGKLSFRTNVIELVGEGALKKAYDALKKKLETEGLFAPERKKSIPQFPRRIGLITSRNGAVIGDFSTNIGRFGYKIILMDSRVEGAAAIGDLINAVDYFSDKDIDVLVIIRGGGSLESLQAFNNEMLVRKVANLKMPVICGIGHDKDVPLLSYVADVAVSTPTAVAQALNKSWQEAIGRLNFYESNIFKTFEKTVGDLRLSLGGITEQIKDFYFQIFRRFERYEQAIKELVSMIGFKIKEQKGNLKQTSELLNYHFCYNIGETKKTLNAFGNEFYNRHLMKNICNGMKNIEQELRQFGKLISAQFGRGIGQLEKRLDSYERDINSFNPERQLKLGYSIIRINGKIIKSASQIREGDEMISKLSDGEVYSKAQKIFNQ